MSTEIKKPYIEYGIKWGVILAVILCVFHYTMLYMNAGFALTIGQWISFALIITVDIIVGINARKIAGGVLTYSNAYVALLFMAMVSSLIYITVDFVVKSYVDTSLVAIEKKITLENTEKMMERFGAPEEKIDKTLEEMQERDFRPTVLNSLIGFVSGMAIKALILLLIAAIVKKKPKVTKEVIIEPAP